MAKRNFNDILGITACIVMLTAALTLTFTVNDYYIFNRFSQFGVVFCVSQWIKKAGLLLLPMAVFLKSRRAADISKYILPAAVLASIVTVGNYFEITVTADDGAQEFYNGINLFMPTWANITLFCVQCVSCVITCCTLFYRHGFAVKSPLCLVTFVCALAACAPLNIFENFFDINQIAADSFLRFYNYTVWHLMAVIAVAAACFAAYFYARKKTDIQKLYILRVVAIVLLIQYHSKNSMVMGDGYNVYHTLFACIPLFICNIGVYVASLAVFLNKKILYAISFFVHAGGAITVFVYFGKNSMSNYGIFCSYSILYFIITHGALFMLCVLPVAFKLYKFTIKQCIVPLIYYFAVIVCASVAGAAVTSYSVSAGLTGDSIIYPNYSFTQINPLPFNVPAVLTIKLWQYDINVLYILGLYAAYVGIFFTFYGLYRLWLFVCGKIYARKTAAVINPEALNEAAAVDTEENNG